MTQTHPESLTWTAEELSKLIPLGINQVYEAAKAGQIPHIKVGRRLLFPRQRILAWLNGHDNNT
jgi:excisionase family DNA binding protein